MPASVHVPGQPRLYVEAEWRHALIVVGRGEVEVQCLTRPGWGFDVGDILYLDQVPLPRW